MGMCVPARKDLVRRGSLKGVWEGKMLGLYGGRQKHGPFKKVAWTAGLPYRNSALFLRADFPEGTEGRLVLD